LIYAIANQKGGVGKTTTAINLAATLAQAGERVLLIDMDSQANASTGLGVRVGSDELSMLEVLLGEATIEAIVRETVVAGLALAPSSPEMAGASVLLAEMRERETRLRTALAETADVDYSFIFIDGPPSLGLLTLNALVAADQVIVPVQAEYYALEGMAQLLQTVDAVRSRFNTDVKVSGLIMTMVDLRTNLAREVEQEVRKHFPDLTFRTIVPRNVRLAEAPSHGLPVSLLDPHCLGSNAYFDLAKEVVDRE
jgi:chromosome partitioning protein